MEMDDDEIISDQQFLGELENIGLMLDQAVDRLARVLVQFQQRFDEGEDHDCPVDHTVVETGDQAKYRLSEAIMWLQATISTKTNVEAEQINPEKVN